VEHAAHKRIGVTYPDDAFASAVLSGVQAAPKTNGTEPAAVASYVRQTVQVGGAIDKARAANPEAVVRGGRAVPFTDWTMVAAQ
jgi:hypothetical protein